MLSAKVTFTLEGVGIFCLNEAEYSDLKTLLYRSLVFIRYISDLWC